MQRSRCSEEKIGGQGSGVRYQRAEDQRLSLGLLEADQLKSEN